eukprot:Ihof_evm1s811 gene=Ihof_evmTU1s811
MPPLLPSLLSYRLLVTDTKKKTRKTPKQETNVDESLRMSKQQLRNWKNVTHDNNKEIIIKVSEMLSSGPVKEKKNHNNVLKITHNNIKENTTKVIEMLSSGPVYEKQMNENILEATHENNEEIIAKVPEMLSSGPVVKKKTQEHKNILKVTQDNIEERILETTPGNIEMIIEEITPHNIKVHTAKVLEMLSSGPVYEKQMNENILEATPDNSEEIIAKIPEMLSNGPVVKKGMSNCKNIITVTQDNIEDIITKVPPLLFRRWGHESLQPYQKEVITHALLGHDTFVITPTGSLIKDQVEGLRKRGFFPVTLQGSRIGTDKEMLEKLLAQKPTHLYITPERAMGSLNLLSMFHKEHPFTLIALDEAHCISEWGHDFRPDYGTLHVLRAHIPDVPIMALTATATKEVINDMKEVIGIEKVITVRTSVDRRNLRIQLQEVTGDVSVDFVSVIKKITDDKMKGVLIYCTSKAQTQSVSAHLTACGLSTDYYHASRTTDERALVQEKFMTDQLDALVATNAFGMGIDKPDIEWVIHYGIPTSIESYFQQIGRAGRDGRKATCDLWWSVDSFKKTLRLLANSVVLDPCAIDWPDRLEDEFEPILHNIIDSTYAGIRWIPGENIKLQQFKKMFSFTFTDQCRRKILLEFFDEHPEWIKCMNCDNCDITMRTKKFHLANLSYDAFLMLSMISALEKSRALKVGIDTLLGTVDSSLLPPYSRLHALTCLALKVGIDTLLGTVDSSLLPPYSRLHALTCLGDHHSRVWWENFEQVLVQNEFVTYAVRTVEDGSFHYNIPVLSPQGKKLYRDLCNAITMKWDNGSWLCMAQWIH